MAKITGGAKWDAGGAKLDSEKKINQFFLNLKES